jgi:hypothetical protein
VCTKTFQPCPQDRVIQNNLYTLFQLNVNLFKKGFYLAGEITISTCYISVPGIVPIFLMLRCLIHSGNKTILLHQDKKKIEEMFQIPKQ